MKNWTKTPQGRSHTTGVTLVKLSPFTTAYGVLTPGAPVQKFGSFSKAWAAAKAAVVTLEG